MSAPRPSAVAIMDGEITIDAELLAPGLGLSTEALRVEMRRGLVYGTVENGIGEDQGRLRLSLRNRARSWTVVIEPGGTLLQGGFLAGQEGPDRVDPVARASGNR